MKTVALTIMAYCLVALVAFGDILAPLGFLLLWGDRLGIPSYPLLVWGSLVLTSGIFLIPRRSYFPTLVKVPMFVALSLTVSTLLVGIYADKIRKERLAAFNADVSFQHSFFRSVREAPREFQFYLHAAALKNCVPYAWSYRTMSFYQLHRDVAVNVLPTEWLEHCSIRNSSR